jgi:hypothetical protein
MMPQSRDALFLQLYFQSPGIAEAEFEQAVSRSIRSLLYAASGDAPRHDRMLPTDWFLEIHPRTSAFSGRLRLFGDSLTLMSPIGSEAVFRQAGNTP